MKNTNALIKAMSSNRYQNVLDGIRKKDLKNFLKKEGLFGGDDIKEQVNTRLPDILKKEKYHGIILHGHLKRTIDDPDLGFDEEEQNILTRMGIHSLGDCRKYSVIELSINAKLNPELFMSLTKKIIEGGGWFYEMYKIPEDLAKHAAKQRDLLPDEGLYTDNIEEIKTYTSTTPLTKEKYLENKMAGNKQMLKSKAKNRLPGILAIEKNHGVILPSHASNDINTLNGVTKKQRDLLREVGAETIGDIRTYTNMELQVLFDIDTPNFNNFLGHLSRNKAWTQNAYRNISQLKMLLSSSIPEIEKTQTKNPKPEIKQEILVAETTPVVTIPTHVKKSSPIVKTPVAQEPEKPLFDKETFTQRYAQAIKFMKENGLEEPWFFDVPMSDLDSIPPKVQEMFEKAKIGCLGDFIGYDLTQFKMPSHMRIKQWEDTLAILELQYVPFHSNFKNKEGLAKFLQDGLTHWNTRKDVRSIYAPHLKDEEPVVQPPVIAKVEPVVLKKQEVVKTEPVVFKEAETEKTAPAPIQAQQVQTVVKSESVDPEREKLINQKLGEMVADKRDMLKLPIRDLHIHLNNNKDSALAGYAKNRHTIVGPIILKSLTDLKAEGITDDDAEAINNDLKSLGLRLGMRDEAAKIVDRDSEEAKAIEREEKAFFETLGL